MKTLLLPLPIKPSTFHLPALLFLLLCAAPARSWSGDLPLTDILLDVTSLGSGDEATARQVATEEVPIAPRYKSVAVETKIFEGTLATPDFTTRLAVFSDDGCDVWIDGEKVQERFGLGQALPNLTASFHGVSLVLAPHHNYEVKVKFRNSYYIDQVNSPLYPDIDGVTLFLYRDQTAPEPTPVVPRPPAEPGTPTVVMNPDGSRTYTWEDRSDNEDYFAIQEQNNSGQWVEVARVGPGVTTVTIPASVQP